MVHDIRVQGEADLRSGAVTIVFFMSVTCEVCHEIAPELQKLFDKYQSRGLTVIAVHSDIYGAKMDDEVSKVKKFIDDKSLSFPVVTAAATDGDPEQVQVESTFNQLYLEGPSHLSRFLRQ